VVRVRQPRLIRQRTTNIPHLALIPRLLLQLPHGRLLGRLALVDQARGEFDADGFDGRTVLQDYHGGERARGVPDDGRDGDSVNAGRFASFARGGLPDAFPARLWAVSAAGC